MLKNGHLGYYKHAVTHSICCVNSRIFAFVLFFKTSILLEMDVFGFWGEGVSIVWAAFPELEPPNAVSIVFSDDWTSVRREGVSWTITLTHACANIYTALIRCVDQTVLTRARSNFSNKSAVKEMALDVALWCKQLEFVVLLLACLCSPVLLCPQGCQCGRENQMIYAECYDLNSMKSIPAGIPADTTTLWVSH